MSLYSLYRLAPHEEVAQSLGLCTQREKGFHLDLEDYLLGTLSISHELARLAINSVSAGKKCFYLPLLLAPALYSWSLPDV